MSITLNYNSKQEFLTFRAEGDISVNEIELSMLQMFDSSEFQHDVNALWDVRDLSFENIDMSFLKQLVAVKRKYDNKRGDAKIAIISNYALAAPIIKLYIILAKGLGQKTSAFTSIEQAELWLSKGLLQGSKRVRQLN